MVIVGGESGAGARPMAPEWARDLRDQSTNAGVAFFLKQLGGVRNKRGGDAATVDGKYWHQTPFSLASDICNHNDTPAETVLWRN